MKRIVLIALAAAALVAGVSSCKKYETVKNDPLKTKMYTLDNGLKVYMTVNKEEPRIQTYIAVKVGGKNDPSETTGLAHYFEHLMFKGTQQFGTSDYEAEKPLLDQIEALFETYRQTKDEAERAAIYHQIDSISYEASKISIPNEYDKLMAVIGSDGTNAWTSYDETVYTEDIPSNQIENWAKIQSDRFKNTVVRGFHTELETIYEEKNMSLTKDSRKVWEALYQGLFPNHPYGRQTVLGTQEALKNPSITNVKKYHDTYYVPNNVAICLSGDFNPDEMVSIIEKYFGDWEPNPEIPVLEYDENVSISSPIVKEVYGLEAEMLAIGWPLPGAKDLKTSAVAEVAGSLLNNGMAGLVDLDLIQQQKVLGAQCGAEIMPDLSCFIALGVPKQDQSLEEVRDLLLGEIAKLKAGEFDDALFEGIMNNIKLRQMQILTQNSSRAHMYVNAFINGIDWADAANEVERYASITREDVLKFAETYLGDQNYAVVYKRQGEDTTVQKISAPSITPIVTNRDKKSAFLEEVAASQVKPIEPVFVDFSKDMSKFSFAEGYDVLYKKNELNDIFELNFIFNTGSENDPELSSAFDYIEYLGTPERSAEQIASEMFNLACSYNFSVGANQTIVNVSGLSENMAEAIKITEDLILNAQPDEAVLANLKSDIFKSRIDAKKSQRACYSHLTHYVTYGPEFMKNITISNDKVAGLTSEELLSKVKELFAKGHETMYYGPAKIADVKSVLAGNHQFTPGAVLDEEKFPVALETPENSVVMTQYDAKQLYYYQYSNRGETFDPAQTAGVRIYNEYFGGGMNSIVFQEMREARGLAYSANARLASPSVADGTYQFSAFIATQNDKLQTAVEAFDDIINNMPESEAAFSVAKEALISYFRTQRVNGASVLNLYRKCRRMGLDEPQDKDVFEAIQNMTLEDVKAVQQQWVKDRNYTYAILGDIKDLDTEFLSTLGPVKEVSLEEIFGY